MREHRSLWVWDSFATTESQDLLEAWVATRGPLFFPSPAPPDLEYLSDGPLALWDCERVGHSWKAGKGVAPGDAGLTWLGVLELGVWMRMGLRC